MSHICNTLAFFEACMKYERKTQQIMQRGWDMLIFQPHPPHIIPNSRWPLHDLSHLKIMLWRARSPYQHVTLKN